MNDRFTELDSLLIGWETETLSESERQRLQTLLKEDPEARERFVQWQMLTAALDLESHAAPLVDQERSLARVPPLPERAKRGWLATFSAFALAASILTAAWLAWTLFSSDTNLRDGQKSIAENTPGEEITSQGVAILTRLVEPVWAEGESSRQVGEALNVGRFHLASGLAQIEFFCGATIVVEGPADLQLESAKHARIRQGRIRANVPPAARGFWLEADKLKVVDLGTEFGLAVSPDAVDVQVFDGEVELYPPSKERRRIFGGQAVSMGNAGTLTESPLQPERFVGISELESLGDRQDALRYERWKSWSETIGGDSRLVTYYAFDQMSDWERRLPCGKRPADRDLDGAIIGAKVAPGRWAEKSALDFKQPADRVRVQIPGEFQSLTFSCWTRIDSLDRMFNSLFLTDSYDLGEPHWQILDSGQLYFSVRPVERAVKEGPRDFKALSPSFWDPSLQGKWIHLAVTFDWDSQTIVHYLNGCELSRHLIPAEQMPPSVQIGAASIGNWELPTIPDAKFAVRNLNGRIDEFMIFSSALTSDEIRDTYENGKP